MKCVILAGGMGSRISEESDKRPKPLIEIGGKPILWHIMKNYSLYGINDFIICCGYKGYMIKEYFANYFLHMSDVTIDITQNKIDIHKNSSEPWKVTLVDTGEQSMTGGRLLRVKDYLSEERDFCFTYGDGVSNVNITQLIDHHRKCGRLATVTAVQPAGRYGALEIINDGVKAFVEKPLGDSGWVNGGFFVLSPKCIERISDDQTVWEAAPLEGLAAEGQLTAYLHKGFWHPMDTLRDKNYLEKLWQSGKAPWKSWQ
ncbi:MAG: glucose-1-phosphate cytidylyltransferase [Nitratireductor sp.]|nr:glucose-1-phosphate cytidylyltransferase [Nitratireductor sp.]